MTERAVSDVVGYILVFSVVSLSVAVVSLAGVSALEDARNSEQIANAERAFDVLADNLGDIHQEGAPSRSTEISLASARIRTDRTTTAQVRAYNGTGWINLTGMVTSDLLVWQSNEVSSTEIAYAMGTVIRSQAQGGVVLRGGPFRFDDDRTILPLVQTYTRSGQSFGGGIIRVRGIRSNPTLPVFGDVESSWQEIWFNLSTPHEESWQRYLASHSLLDCPEPTGSWNVTCQLTTVPNELYVTVHPVEVELER